MRVQEGFPEETSEPVEGDVHSLEVRGSLALQRTVACNLAGASVEKREGSVEAGGVPWGHIISGHLDVLLKSRGHLSRSITQNLQIQELPWLEQGGWVGGEQD